MARLTKLEVVYQPPKRVAPWYRIIADSNEEADAAKAAMITSGEAREDDNFICNIIVDPAARGRLQDTRVMSRAVLNRLEILEKNVTVPDGKVHMILGNSAEELADKRLALKGSADWSEGDHLLAIRFVSAIDGRPA